MTTSTPMTAAQQVERVLKPIQQFVRGWMIGAPNERLAVDLGMQSGEDLWIVGRAGVLGDGDADVAAAGLAFCSLAGARCVGITPRRSDAATGRRRVCRVVLSVGLDRACQVRPGTHGQARRTGPTHRGRWPMLRSAQCLPVGVLNLNPTMSMPGWR